VISEAEGEVQGEINPVFHDRARSSRRPTSGKRKADRRSITRTRFLFREAAIALGSSFVAALSPPPQRRRLAGDESVAHVSRVR